MKGTAAEYVEPRPAKACIGAVLGRDATDHACDCRANPATNRCEHLALLYQVAPGFKSCAYRISERSCSGPGT